MNKIFRYVLFIIISFICINNVNAECSYKERKELLNAAKNLEIGYDIDTRIEQREAIDPYTDEVIFYNQEIYSLKFYITNFNNNIFIKYYNGFETEQTYYVTIEDLKDGVYNFVDSNVTDIYKYYFEIYSLNENCAGDLITTRKVIKPIFNMYSDFSICNKKEMQGYKNCNKFITKEVGLNESEFLTAANSYYENHKSNDIEDENNTVFNFIKKNWIMLSLSLCLIIIIIIIVIRIKKKKGELV